MRYLLLCVMLGLGSFSYCADKDLPVPAKETTAPILPAPLEPPITPDLETPPLVPSSEELTDSYQHAFGKMFLSLVALLTLLIATIWFLKRLSKGKFRFGVDKEIEILEKRTLSPKTALYLVKIKGKKVLVSESQLEVRMLTTVDSIEEE